MIIIIQFDFKVCKIFAEKMSITSVIILFKSIDIDYLLQALEYVKKIVYDSSSSFIINSFSFDDVFLSSVILFVILKRFASLHQFLYSQQ